MRHYQTVFERWGSKAPDMARALSLPPMTVHQWMLRDSIPAHHWPALTAVSDVTLEELAACARSRASRASRAA